MHRTLTCRYRLLLVFLSVLITVAPMASHAIEQNYHIPAQPLADALLQYTEISGTKVFFSANHTQNRQSPALNGHYSKEQALGKLLHNSGLTYRHTSADSITVEPSNDPQSANSPDNLPMLPLVKVTAKNDNNSGDETTLPKVTVEADAEQAYDPEYYADPYNKDYVIPNATAGTKTDTPIMETPLNVQVISKQVLKDRQIISLDQALKNTSGVTSSFNSSSATFTGGLNQTFALRGFESRTIFRDGFRLQDATNNREMANIESVEVLKGPAAILYGQVEPGGMVNVTTKQPLSTPYYGMTQQFGSYDLYRTTFDATGPLTQNKDLLYRMNMSYQNSGSFREFVNKEDVFFAPVLRWNISPRTQATFELEYNHQHAGLDSAFVPFIDGKLLDVPFARNYGEYSPSTTEAIFGSFNWSHQFNDDWVIKHRFAVNHQTNDLSLVAASGVDDLGKVGRYQFGDNFKLNTYSTNLDLIGHFDTMGLKHTLLFGGDYYRIDRKETGLLNLVDAISFANNESFIDLVNPVHPGTRFPGQLQPSFFQDMRTDLYGLYIQDQIKLPYGFQVMGGIRYQYLHQKTLDQGLGLLASAPTYTTMTDDAVTPRVGILWQPKSWISLYANYVESFGANTGKLQVGNGEKPVPATSAEQYEGGIKTEFFGGRLRATLAYFDLTKNNIATPHPNPALGNAGFSVITGAARSRGPELDITGEILPGWNVIATYANLDTKVLQTNDNSNGQTPMTGSRFFNVPRNTGSIWSTYEILDGDFKGIKIGGGATFRDGQIGCCDTPSFKIPGYATVDLLAAYSVDIGKTKITAQLNINNLLDKRYYAGIFSQKDSRNGGVDFGMPRTFMGQISVQY